MTAFEADIESDLSVFHRIDDMYEQPAERIFRLARRLSHYQGVVRSSTLAAHRRQEAAATARIAQPEVPRVGPRPGSLFSFATSGGGES